MERMGRTQRTTGDRTPRSARRFAGTVALLAAMLAPAAWAGPEAGGPQAAHDGRSAAAAAAAAAPASAASASSAAPTEIRDWVERIHRAALAQSYQGSFVVWSSAGGMTSSRIWHATDGTVQIERIEALDGSPRTVFQRGELVRTFLPQARVVKEERRDMPGLFPPLLQAGSGGGQGHYPAPAGARDPVVRHGAEGVLV